MNTTTFARPSALTLASEVLMHASQWIARFTPSHPAPTRASEASGVREMARRLQFSDPGFASDLLAAADRHERDGESPR